MRAFFARLFGRTRRRAVLAQGEDLWTGAPPARPALPVVDLDAVSERSLPFLLHGKRHEIRPIQVQEFYGITNSFAEMKNRYAAGPIDSKQLVDMYLRLFQSVVPTITRADVQEMTQAQCASLFLMILAKLEGRDHDLAADDLKKKSRT